MRESLKPVSLYGPQQHTRRTFLAWSGSALALLGFGRASLEHGPGHLGKRIEVAFLPAGRTPVPPGIVRSSVLLPAGFRFQRQAPGHVQGFGSRDGEFAYVFAHPHMDRMEGKILMLYSPAPDATLYRTANRPIPDEPVLFEARSGRQISAAYIAGIWTMGEGAFQRQTNRQKPFYWSNEASHSLVVRGTNGNFAIRGSRAAGVTRDDLVAAASSVL
jgi:hypothetical protein